MYLEFANACVLARETKGYTQEELAELCSVSRQSISDYERGESLPKENVVVKLIEVLESNFVGYAYLRSNKIGEMILPEIQQKNLSANILGLQADMDDVTELRNDIAKIGRDDKVDNIEHPKWLQCIKEIKEMIGSGFSVWLSSQKKEKSPVLAHRRIS